MSGVHRLTGRSRKRLARHQRLSRGVPKYDPAWQSEAARFVTANNIGCFKCSSRDTMWHKVGRKDSGRPWAICVTCAKGPR